MDQAQFVVGPQDAGRRACFAQQPLQLLVRRRLPSRECATRFGFDAALLDADEDLPAVVRVGHGPMGAQIGIALFCADRQVVWKVWTAGSAVHLLRPPAPNLREELHWAVPPGT